MNLRLTVIVGGVLLLIPAWIGLYSSNMPTLFAPFPALTFLPALLLSELRLWSLAVLIPTILFLLWTSGRLSIWQSKVPTRTLILLATLSVLTIADFKLSWNYGVQYQGRRHTIAVDVINLLWLVCLWTILYWTRRRPSFRTNLLLHWLLFAWLSWYAFPHLGELP
jgi:hypothetical protein